MLTVPFYQVDAFTSTIFNGNPAAVLTLNQWLPDHILQQIAFENNLSETAFYVIKNKENIVELRWFTPSNEVDLCGHATLAAALVYCKTTGKDVVTFSSRSGKLKVQQEDKHMLMDFPAYTFKQVSGYKIQFPGSVDAISSDDLLIVFENQQQVLNYKPDFNWLGTLPFRGIIVAAPGDERSDIVSRFFAPSVGVNEDPVTGSAHCLLAPYWHSITGKNTFICRQLSSRGGELICDIKGNRVTLIGKAQMVIEGSFNIPQ